MPTCWPSWTASSANNIQAAVTVPHMGLLQRYHRLRNQKKGAELMRYQIISVRGHYEVYDNQGNFICSADTKSEAMAELEAA